MDHRVDHLGVAHARAEPRLRHEVRRLRHRLHAAGDHHLHLTGADQLIGKRNGVEAGQADLVDGDCRDLLRDARLDRGLAGGDLARAGLEDMSHDHVIDLVSRHAAAFESRPDSMAAKGDRRHIFESSAESAERRARARYDHRRHTASLGGGESPI